MESMSVTQPPNPYAVGDLLVVRFDEEYYVGQIKKVGSLGLYLGKVFVHYLDGTEEWLPFNDLRIKGKAIRNRKEAIRPSELKTWILPGTVPSKGVGRVTIPGPRVPKTKVVDKVETPLTTSPIQEAPVSEVNEGPKPGEKGMALPPLLKYQDPKTVSGARSVRVRILHTNVISGRKVVTAATNDIASKSEKVYESRIEGLYPHQPISGEQQRVKVFCNCGDFIFRREYALAHHGVSEIRLCNGEPPHVNVPAYGVKQVGLQMCKHLAALAFEVAQKGI